MGTEATRTPVEALAAAAAARPAHPAIVEEGRELDYAGLDAAAMAIAKRVLAASRGARGLACLLFERRIDALPAFYGVMRAGSGAVPLDLEDPDDRLRAIVEAAAPLAILAAGSTLDRARAIAPEGCAIVDTTTLSPAASDDVALPAVAPDDIALCPYTSGSTGVPKGVLLTHRSLMHFADVYVDAIRGAASDRQSWLPKLSFGASVPDILGALVRGATLVCYDVRRQGARGLAAWVVRERVTILHALPKVVREMLDGLAPGERLDGLRAVDTAGQPLFVRDVERLRRHVREDCVIVHRLAATEHNIAAIHVVGADDARSRDGVLAVGRPAPGARIEILRDDGTPAAVDEVGDVVVAGAHVSPGYRDAGDADADAIAPDPAAPGERRFRSGDIGRIDASGDLHLVGRRGSRVRVQGHSVDLVEVEAALSRCAGVRDTAVVVPSREPDRLVAYVVPAEDAMISAASLRRELAARVPRYMLPNAFVFLDAMACTTTGKPDRRELASRAPPIPRLAPSEPSRDDLERAIAAIFEDMLAVSPVGRGDDFFLLGGDSLALAELQARIREACGATLQTLDDEMTPAGLAAQVRRARAAAPADDRAAPVLLPLREHGAAPPLFLVHGRLGQAPVSPRLLRLLGDDQPVWAFRARGLDAEGEAHETVEAMAEDYLAALREQQPSGPYFLGALCAGAYVAVEMARRLDRAGELVLPLLLIDPPQRVFPMTGYAMSDAVVLKRLQARRHAASIDAPIDDPEYARAAIRTAVAFERAIAAFQPRRYDGAVYMLSSKERALATDPELVRRLYPGAERVEIGERHLDALDPDNPELARHLARFLARVRDAASRLAASGALPR